MIRYALLLVTWLAVLASMVYFWIKDGSSPSVWLWIVFALLSVIPLAGRLKIGSWFDFRKDVNAVGQEVATPQERITTIGSLNIQLYGEEAARTFAQQLFPYTEPDGLAEKKELSNGDKEVITFNYNVDKAIASLLPLLRIIYSAISNRQLGLKLGSKEWGEKSPSILNQDILFMMQEIKEHVAEVAPIKDAGEKFVELFEPVEKLVKLRRAIEETGAKPPREEAIALVSKVYYASGFLSGLFEVGMLVLFAMGSKTDTQ